LPPLLVEPDGHRWITTQDGLPLGIATSKFSETEITLGPQARLAFYSDGITESLNNAGEEFGYARLEKQLRRAQAASTGTTGSADTMLFSVLGAVQDFAAIRPLTDDMTLAVIRRDGVSANVL